MPQKGCFALKATLQYCGDDAGTERCACKGLCDAAMEVEGSFQMEDRKSMLHAGAMILGSVTDVK